MSGEQIGGCSHPGKPTPPREDGPEAGYEPRTTAHEPPVRRSGAHRSVRQRLAICLGAVGSVLVLLTASLLGYVNWRLGQIGRIDLHLADAPAGAGENYLVVGSDSRAGIKREAPNAGALLNGTEYLGKPKADGYRTDTIMIVHIDPTGGDIRLLSIPRNLYVPIAGTSQLGRIKTAAAISVPTLVQTLHNTLGIEINHFVETNLAGFQKLVDAMGGVRVHFDVPMWDGHTGLAIPSAGCQTLDGAQALAYARSRHLWFNTLGKADVDTTGLGDLSLSQLTARGWHLDPSGGFGRTKRQQHLVQTAIPQAEHAALGNPATLNALVDAAVHSITLDSSLTATKLIRLTNRLRSIDSANMVTYNYPSQLDIAPTAGAVLLPLEREAKPILQYFRDHPLSPENLVSVQIVNASDRPDLGANVAGALQRVGFLIDRASASVEQNELIEVSQIRYPVGEVGEAKLVAEHLTAPVKFVPLASGSTGDITVIAGTNFDAVTSKRRKLQADELPPRLTAPTPRQPQRSAEYPQSSSPTTSAVPATERPSCR